MPYKVKRFIQYWDHESHFWRSEHSLPKADYFQLTPGGYTYPKDTDTDYLQSKPYLMPLFIHNTTKIVDDIGQYGVIYLLIRPNMILENVYLEPKEIIVDISFFTDKTNTFQDRLIYSFYNPTKSDIVSIDAKTSRDDDTIGKIKSNPDDLEYRQYILKNTLSISSVKFAEETYPEYMTVVQVAKFLQVKEKTIRNWTSKGEIPVTKLPTGTVRYKLSEIKKWMEGGNKLK